MKLFVPDHHNFSAVRQSKIEAMLRHLSAFLLLSALAFAQNTVPGCANRQVSPSLAQTTEEKEKVGLKQRLKDQFGSGWCANVLVASGCQKEKPAEPEPSPTPSSAPKPPESTSSSSSAPPQSTTSPSGLEFPEEQSRRAEQEANASRGRSSGESSSRDVNPGPQPSEIEVMEMKKFDPHKAEKDVEVGDFYYRRQNYRAAASRYKEATELKPSFPVATFKLADAYEKSDQFDEAAVYYREYLRAFPSGEQAPAAREALARLAPHLRADAQTVLKEQVARDLKAGELLFYQKNYPDAVNRFCDVAAADPANARGIFRLAQSLQQIGEFAPAYANYDSYLKLEPEGPFADLARQEMQRLRPQLQGSVTSPSAGTRP